MMKLTKEAADMLQQQVTNPPLAEGEMRRMEGFGNLYASLERHQKDEDSEGEFRIESVTYWHQYSLWFEGNVYHFFAGTHALVGPTER